MIRHRPLPYLLLGLLFLLPASAQTPAKQAEQQYQQALTAINSADWAKAEKEMAAAQKALAKIKNHQASGALYWTAYAQAKLGERMKALSTLDQLASERDHSDWSSDAAALRAQLQPSSVFAPMPPIPPMPRMMPIPPNPPDGRTGSDTHVSQADELKLLALNGLMNSDPAKALPLLQQVIQGHSDATVKDRALFVLAQNNSPAALAALTQIAQSNADPDLRSHAVRYLGMMGGTQGAAALAKIYATSSSTALKRAILRSYMIGGDTSQLITVAKSEKDPDLRSEAIRELGISGSPQALAALAGLYQGARNRTASTTVIQALFLHGSAKALVNLARQEKDPQLKEDIVRRLSLMHDPAAIAYLEELLKQ